MILAYSQFSYKNKSKKDLPSQVNNYQLPVAFFLAT